MLHVRGPQLLSELKSAAEKPVATHPVLRDVWSDHVLFEGARVTGIIDYGALRMDEPAADLARLLGSLHPFELDARIHGVEEYNSRALSAG